MTEPTDEQIDRIIARAGYERQPYMADLVSAGWRAAQAAAPPSAPTPAADDVVVRLRTEESENFISRMPYWYRDFAIAGGRLRREAADRIEQQAAEIARLRAFKDAYPEWVDESGETWVAAGGWAYSQACRVIREQKAELAAARDRLAHVGDALRTENALCMDSIDAQRRERDLVNALECGYSVMERRAKNAEVMCEGYRAERDRLATERDALRAELAAADGMYALLRLWVEDRDELTPTDVNAALAAYDAARKGTP